MEANGDDSNALILPAKTNKKNKPKPKPQIKSCIDQKLSKSQKRKLRKLAEEKQQEQLLAKSLQTLEKYKINEDAYTLMLSSEKIGQAFTKRDKRMREMQFSKAGLEVPENDILAKKRKVEGCGNEGDESDDYEVNVQAQDDVDMTMAVQVVDVGVVKHTSSTLVVPSDDANGTSAPSEVSENVPCEDDWKLSSCHSPNSDKNITAIMDEEDGEHNENRYKGKCEDAVPVSRVSVPPTVVHVSRPKEVERTRKDLPIIMMEQEIMEAINNNSCVIICGETGCGKTTQVPQFLYEAGYGSSGCSMRSGLGITQPRRVAVLSTSKRVAYELGLSFGKEVGFQVRHDKWIGKNGSMKFMTDGILLRELQNDPSLRQYSVLILDEAHERSLNTDILIGMLSRIVEVRQDLYKEQQKKKRAGVVITPENRIFPLKLILMSATLRVEDFISNKKLFSKGPPPVIEIPTRQFPVVKHFSKKTELVDYIGEAFKKVLKIHKRLPSGGILVFVTGQREVEYLCCKLRDASRQFEMKRSKLNTKSGSTTGVDIDQIDGYNMDEINEAVDTCPSSAEQDRLSCYDECSESESYDSYSFRDSGTDSGVDSESDEEVLEDEKSSKLDDDLGNFSEDVNLNSLKAAFEALSGNTSSGSPCDPKETTTTASKSHLSISNLVLVEQNGEEKGAVGPLHVLPLYAMLPAAAQLRVFEKVKEGERLVVVATNVAETSLTIPGIKYVVDTGREKVKNYNKENGMESYEIQWISKASAAQRAGRAGRTGPGHCYCLYSSAAFTNQFPDFSCPDIKKIPTEGVVLFMKSIGIDKVANFPFPTPPDHSSLVEAERCLKALEALDSEGRITPLGKSMSQYPMSPRHSRLLLSAIQIIKTMSNVVRPRLVLGYAVAVAAALSLQNPFQFDRSQNNDISNKVDGQSGSLGTQKQKSSKKQMKEIVKQSYEKFYNPKSDALTVAYALQCFEQAENKSDFCRKYALVEKTMEELSKLRKQLLQLVIRQGYSGKDHEFSWTSGTTEDIECYWRASCEKNPLRQGEENILCQAICAGWADRVAKRKNRTSVTEEDRKVKAVPYEAFLVTETVFLHRRSAVNRSAPDFLVYTTLLDRKPSYIQGTTSVESELDLKRPFIEAATSVDPVWLVKYAGSLCTFSAPLPDQKPLYDPHTDEVFCNVIPVYGRQSWKLELPSCKIPIEDVQQRVIAFAYALLEGDVLPCLQSAREIMSGSPSNLLRKEALGQKRVGNLLSKLNTKSRTIDSCAMLRKVWKENPRYLYAEILDWFQGGFHSQFAKLWQTMHREAFLAPKDRFPDGTKKKKKKAETSQQQLG